MSLTSVILGHIISEDPNLQIIFAPAIGQPSLAKWVVELSHRSGYEFELEEVAAYLQSSTFNPLA